MFKTIEWKENKGRKKFIYKCNDKEKLNQWEWIKEKQEKLDRSDDAIV